MGFIAYHFHWSRDEILDMPHKERHRWVQVISEINRKINASQKRVASVARPASGVRRGPGMGFGGLALYNE